MAQLALLPSAARLGLVSLLLAVGAVVAQPSPSVIDEESLPSCVLFQHDVKMTSVSVVEVGSNSSAMTAASAARGVTVLSATRLGALRSATMASLGWVEEQLAGYAQGAEQMTGIPSDFWKELWIPEQFHPILDGIVAASIIFVTFFIFAVAQPGGSGIWSLFLKCEDTVELQNENVRRVMKEHQQLPAIRRSLTSKREKLQVVDLGGELSCLWYCMPLLVSLFFVLCPLSLLMHGWYYTGLLIPAVCVVYNSWRFGVHGVICSCVGLKKLALYDGADFEKLYRSEADPDEPAVKRDLGSQLIGDGADSVFEGKDWDNSAHDDTLSVLGPAWQDIIHFVILPNYDEDLETLRGAIRTVAASKLAKEQIGLVLGMEDREATAKAKAEQLQNEFRSSFRYCLATFHEPDLPGESPGKHSNTRCAARYLFDHFIPENKVNLDNVVLTVADSDSDFHPEYFAALTYSYIRASSVEGEVPRRHLAIWQAPILHLKNYVSQPAMVKMASWIASLHELSNLADPSAVKLAYSTYSLSGTLAASVGGWDPDWISEDMHMALKCFLATAGRLSIEPIFLGVVNYAPAGGTYVETIWARWAQAKRHALGFGEFVYILGHIPRVIAALTSWEEKFTFMYRAFFMMLKVLFIHLFLVLSCFIGPVVGSCMVFFYNNHMARGLLPIFVVFQGLTTISLNIAMVISVLLYESQKARIQDLDQATSIFWRHRWLHVLTAWLQYNMLAPPVFILASCAEWLAAFKIVGTRRFEYEVAPKPQSSPGRSEVK